jgi:hypothetical protein
MSESAGPEEGLTEMAVNEGVTVKVAEAVNPAASVAVMV